MEGVGGAKGQGPGPLDLFTVTETLNDFSLCGLERSRFIKLEIKTEKKFKSL